jgi:hypothetical protein
VISAALGWTNNPMILEIVLVLELNLDLAFVGQPASPNIGCQQATRFRNHLNDLGVDGLGARSPCPAA